MYQTGYTHAGVFHADDVFATALLKIMNPEIKIHRVNYIPDGITDHTEDVIIYDIGGGKYDHHKTPKLRKDGIPYSSFGLLWRDLGTELVDKDSADLIERSLVIPIDLQDNGKERNPLSNTISLFNPLWGADEDLRTQFDRAVDMAMQILNRSLESIASANKAKTLVEQKIRESENHVMVLDQYVPYQRYLKNDNDIYIVVYPSMRGGWNLQSINSDTYPLPESWLKSLPENMTFAHPGRFVANCKDKLSAIRYAETAALQYA